MISQPQTLRKSLLTHAIEGDDGPADLPIWLVLHDRHGDLAAARSLGLRYLSQEALRITVRSARTQTRGSIAPPKGHFWFIGACEKPELMTLCDGLIQLEALIEDIDRRFGSLRPIHVLGQGEGATMALLLGLLRSDRVAHVVLVDAHCPLNIARIPMELGPKPWPFVQLIDQDPMRVTTTVQRLSAFGIELAVFSDASLDMSPIVS